MKIGIAGPIHLSALNQWCPLPADLPPPYSFPLIGPLAARLRTRGFPIVVFCGSPEAKETRHIVGDGVEIYITPRRRRWAAYDFYSTERRDLMRAMQSSPCDILHAHWCYEFGAAALDSRTVSLITCHDSPNEVYHYMRWTKAYPFWWFRCLLGRKVLRQAEYISAVSPYVEMNVRSIAGQRSRLRVIPNGVSESLFSLGKERLAHGEPLGNLTFASVLEGFSRIKNPTTALLAFANFRQKHPMARFRMFGGDYEPGGKAEKWAQANNCAEGVSFEGHTPQKILHPLLHSSVHILLHPSRTESHPLAVIEAQAMGIPVIGGDCSGGVPFTLAHGEAGFLADIRSAQSLSLVMQKVASDPEKRKLLAQKAWDFAHKNFSEDKMVEGYLGFYQAILAERKVARTSLL